jgi:beta-aspartyl-dipeptidase (metallo-type)
VRWPKRGASGGQLDLTTSSSPSLLAAGDIPAASALAQLLRDGADIHRIGMSSDAQASLPDFDADGRLRGIATARIDSLPAALREAVRIHGIALSDALLTVTANPASFWGLSRKGRIEAGMDADLLLLDADSLALRYTLAGGRVWDWGTE